MVYHPPGIVVEIVGTDAGDRGRTCEEHPDNCGVVLEEDVVGGRACGMPCIARAFDALIRLAGRNKA